MLFDVTRSSSVRSWLVAESSVTEELMWAKLPADFTIWLKSILAWGYTVVSYSYFADWASALVNADTSAVSLLPACIILLLIPKLLKVLISSICLLSLLVLLWSGFSISLLWSLFMVIMMGLVVLWVVVGVMKWVVDVVVVLDGVLIVMLLMVEVMVVVVVLWVLTVDHMWLSVLGLISLMNGLWVHVMVIVVEEAMLSMVETVVVIVMVIVVVIVVPEPMAVVVSIESVHKWIVVDGFVFTVMIVTMVVIVVEVPMVVVMVSVVVIVMVIIMMEVMALFVAVVLSVDSSILIMVIVVDVVSISVTMLAMTVSVGIVTEVSSPLTVVSMTKAMVSVSESMVSVSKSMASVSESVVTEVAEWSLMVVSSPPLCVMWSFMVSIEVWFKEVCISVVALVWENVANCHVVSIMVCVALSHVVSEISLGVLHLLSVSSNVMMVVWVRELVWEDLQWSLVVLSIDNTDMSLIMIVVVMAEVIKVLTVG